MLSQSNTLNRFQKDVNHMLDLFGFGAPKRDEKSPSSTFPHLNVWEHEDVLYVEAEVPGLSLENLEIFVSEGNRLSIRGEKKAREIDEKAAWYRREVGHGKFERELELPFDIDSERVEAKLVNGILTITLPKNEAVKPRRIEVKGA